MLTSWGKDSQGTSGCHGAPAFTVSVQSLRGSQDFLELIQSHPLRVRPTSRFLTSGRAKG